VRRSHALVATRVWSRRLPAGAWRTSSRTRRLIGQRRLVGAQARFGLGMDGRFPGVRCRSIYDAAVMDDPVGRRVIQTCADAGEQARLLPQVRMKMKLAEVRDLLVARTTDLASCCRPRRNWVSSLQLDWSRIFVLSFTTKPAALQ
jgi:hypothetical protein